MPGYTHLQRAAARLPRAPPPGLLLDVHRDRSRFVVAEEQAGRMPLGAGALAGWASTPTARRSHASSASRVSCRTRSTRSRDVTSSSTACRRPRRARPTCRVWAGSSCCGRARSSASASCRTRGARGRRSCPRRRTRTPRSCCGRRRRGWWLTWGRVRVIHGLPLTYNKDLQEDKEPSSTPPTRSSCACGGEDMLAGARFDRARMQEAAADELIAATDVADLLVRLGVPFRESHGVVAGLVRAAVDGGQRCGAHRRRARSAARSSRHTRGSSARCLESVVARVEGFGGRHVRAARGSS